jgi:hypothetical protein
MVIGTGEGAFIGITLGMIIGSIYAEFYVKKPADTAHYKHDFGKTSYAWNNGGRVLFFIGAGFGAVAGHLYDRDS